MIRNRLILTGLISLLCFALNAQKAISFYGQVRDSTGAVLQYANVMALDTATQTMDGFAVTNAQGEFKLHLATGKAYQLKITFIGYRPFEKIISPNESNKTPMLFILSGNNNQLAEVEIVAEIPVVISGDTITYLAEAFTQGDERKLEDVLEDLPGFQIDDNGQITVQGETVDKVLIDGKEFFDGDAKLATKNIPANVVDKIQLLQNFNDIGPLQNVNNSDQMAINVQLKEDKKRIVFGDITAGLGDRQRYYGHANTFYYSKKTNLNLIADANNIGEPAFTMSDYFRFAGGLGNFTNSNGSSLNLSSDQLGIPIAERNTAKTLDNKLGAFNFTLRPTHGWQFSGMAIGSAVNNTFGSVSNRSYLQESGTVQEAFTSNNFVESLSGIGKLGLQYTPNYNLHVDYQIFARKANTTNGGFQLSEIADQQNEIINNQTQKPWALEQKISSFYALGEKNIISLEASHKLQYQDPVFEMTTDNPPFVGTLELYPQNQFHLQQQRTIRTARFDGLLNYYRILNKTNHINFSVGYGDNRQEYDAGIFQLLDSGEIALDSTVFHNQAEYYYTDAYAGVLYKNKWKKLMWAPQINLHYYEVNHNEISTSSSFNRWLVLPGFTAEYDFSGSQSLHFNYRLNANFMDVQSMASNIILNSYNSLAMGNPELINSRSHAFSLNYRNFNTYNFFNIYGGFTYQLKHDDIQSSFEISEWERISLPVNVWAANKQASAYLNGEKRFNNFRLSLNSSWAYSFINNQLGEVANEAINFGQQYQALFSTRIWKKISLRLTHEFTANTYNNNESSSQFINNESAIRINWKLFKGLNWLTEYAYNNYRNLNTNQPTQYDLLDATMSYRKKGSPWEFSIQGMNLLNTTSIRNDSFTDNLISTYSYNIQRRYVVFMVMFDL